MTDIEKKIVKMRDEGKTFTAISKELGLGYEWCRHLYVRSLRREKETNTSGFPEDMPRTIYNNLFRNGIRTLDDLIRFIDQGGDVKELRHIGVKAEEYILKMVEDIKS